MIRIAIVDDHAVVRAGLRQFLSDQVDMSVVAEAANGREALLIPLSALVERGQVRAVFAAEAGQARLRFVKVGQKTASGEIEILSGLEPGSQFVIDPPFNLKDGAAITATEGN